MNYNLLKYMDNILESDFPKATKAGVIESIPGFLRVIPNTLSQQECTSIIQLAEEKGFIPASFYTDKDGVEHYSEIRKSSRCIIDSTPFAQTLWERVKGFVPETFDQSWKVVGINERLRFLRYTSGDEFKVHTDGTYVSKEGHHSKITILIYLNDTYEGAFTHIITNDNKWLGIQPEVGMLVLQDQCLLHYVPPLTQGVKYVIRTEVMYELVKKSDDIKIIKIN